VSAAAADVVAMTLEPRRPNGSVMERFQMLIPSKMPSNQPGYNLVVHTSVYQLFTGNDRPEIHIGLDAAASLTGFCTISGELTSAE
jgi:hypothetical protein